MAKISVIYHHFPHYRAPVLRELVSNGEYEYSFHASLKDLDGIKVFKGDDLVTINPLRFKFQGKKWVLKDYWNIVLDPSVKVLVILGNPNMPASWFIACVGRLIGKKVLFWAHGWLKKEGRIKQALRNIYFGLAHKTMVYGERAKTVAVDAGFPVHKVWPIYNSLDYEKAKKALAGIKAGVSSDIVSPQSLLIEPKRPVIICTSRITKLCRFDLLLEAAANLKNNGNPINILLVGDGPERKALLKQAEELGVDVYFYGACYDEAEIGSLIYHSDLTVSPGKIGLTAMHSLTYGTPVITHGELDEQMPEIEAIENGKSGLLFTRNDSKDLSDKISFWLAQDLSREEIRRNCQEVIALKWNPKKQRERIEACVKSVLEGK